jgi:glycosyltransferase involved in cell wall biosynthesis
MSRQLQASIIITTFNRANYLVRCLEAVAAQTADHATFEIIVVDNNSTDTTKEVVLTFAQSHPTLQVHYLFEAKQGTSYARNCGVRAASGEYLCFTEDDAAPSPQWLETLVAAFSEADVGCAGGPIIPDYEGQDRPPHLQGDLQGLVGGFQLPYTEPTAVSRWTELPWGGNMAFRSNVFIDAGQFRTDLGPSAKRRLTAEETEMIARAHQSGWKIMYIPSARMKHFVPSERLEKSHLYRVGLGLAASHVVLTSDPRAHMIMRWFASDLWYATRMFFKFVGAIVRRKSLWFDDYMRFWIVAKRIPIRARALLNGYSFN